VSSRRLWRHSTASTAAAGVLLTATTISQAAGPASASANHQDVSADQVAKELANPNNDLAKLAFKNRYTWYDGDLPKADKQDNYSLLFQPVFPFSLGVKPNGNKMVMFARPAIPVLAAQPVFNASQGDFNTYTALGDIGFDWAYGETSKTGFLWAAGVNGTLPTATRAEVAGKQLRLGPEVLIGKVGKTRTLAALVTHQWDVAGWADKSYSQSTLQPTVQFTPGGGWAWGTKGILAYDWKGSQWTVPLNLNVAKTVILGTMPVQFEIELNYYVERPDPFGPKWMVGFNVTPVVRNFIEDAFKR